MSDTKLPTIHLKPGKEKPLLRQHPWIFSGAIARIEGAPISGDVVLVKAASGETIGVGGYSPNSQIRCRVWEFGDRFTDDLKTHLAKTIADRIQQAIALRMPDPFLAGKNACRLIHAESDRLPGLIVDQYADVLVVQFLSAGMEPWRNLVLDTLIQAVSPAAIFERSDVEVRKLEGLVETTGLLYGTMPEEGVIIEENGVRIKVAVDSGHKTGFYLDQRENRALIRNFTKEKDMLDCFCYTGGFTLNALMGGARSVTAIDQSEEALSLLSENIHLNSLAENKVERIGDDVFQRLRTMRDQGKSFDVIVLDPPKFAPTRSQAQKAARGYKDINLLAAKLLREGGVLFTFSCSGGIDQKLFQQIVAGAASDAGVDLQIIHKMGPGGDHPVLLSFPEGDYLKGLVCRRIG